MNKRLLLAVVLAAVAAFYGLRQPHDNAPRQTPPRVSEQTQRERSSNSDIRVLTAEKAVVSYLQQHQRLPDFYISKNQARKQGWEPSKGNLCQTLPGRAIGGDRFGNREKLLPEQAGRQWYEADVNYQCGRRGSDRLLYSSDGLIFITNDHYQNVQQVSR